MYKNQPNYLNQQSGILWRLLRYFYNITIEFLRSTVLNGLKYLTFKYLTLWEKLLFLSCFIAATYNTFNFAMSIVEKWKISPVMVVMNPRISFINNDPFPAITICNMNQAQHSKVKDFDVKSLEYAMLKKLCFQKMNYTSFSHKHPRSKNDTFANFIIKNAQPCSHMLVSCKYGQSKIACTDLFREVLVDEGLCCSFNVVHPYMLYKGEFFLVREYTSIDGPSIPLDWNPEKGYPKELPKSFYPRMPLGDGISNGFTIILNGDYDNYHCSSTNGAGFKVSLHNPIDTPYVREIGLFVPLGFESRFLVTPFRLDAVEALRILTKPIERQCYFSDENSLQYYRYYTQRNCEMECEARFMMQKCDCIPYHLPLLSNNVTACHVKHFDCLIAAEGDLTDNIRLSCPKRCLSNCNTISYYPKSYIAPLENAGFSIKSVYLRNMTKETLEKYAVLNIFFPEKNYRGTVKTPYMGLTEFLSQVGGLMGLMMGFSMISVVEALYFFVIKPLIYAWHKLFHNNTVDLVSIISPDESGIDIHQNPNSRRHYVTASRSMLEMATELQYVH